MDLRDLKLFLHLAESLHFGKTAKSTYVSPSTLSRQIQRLENELGHTLFLRDNRTVELTHAGQQLKSFAQQTLLNYQQLKQNLKKNSTILQGELRLFCSVTAAYSHLPRILDLYREQHSAVEIKLTTGDAADAVDKILSDEVDIAIAGRPDQLPSSLNFAKLGEIPLVLIMPAFLCNITTQINQPEIKWKEIPFILPEHGPSRRKVDQWFRHNHITHPQIYATVAGHEAIVSMVALGCGVALLPEIVVENSPESIRNRITTPENIIIDEVFDLGVCVQKKRLNEPLINAFWQLI